MLIRKATFEKLVKQVQNQEKEIENLNEKVGILAQLLNKQFEFNVGEGWKVSRISPALNKFIEAKRKAGHLSDAEF
jgi:predicted RNase H-like nuclease (RuvC/YqgF family)